MKMQKKIDAILTNINREPLSSSLGKTLRLAERAGDSEVAKWCRLELGGYLASNQAMTEDVVVPEYRTVAGQHQDIYGRTLVCQRRSKNRLCGGAKVYRLGWVRSLSP